MRNPATPSLLRALYALETELHAASPEVRLRALRHAGFREFGRSCEIYTRAQMRQLARSPATGARGHSQDFALLEPAPGLALLSYRSAHPHPDASVSRHTSRMCLHKREVTDWQMIFHQGTPSEPFDPKD